MIKYSKYKSSGIEWLGDIPEHWHIERLHNKCDIVRGNSSFKKDELLSKGKYVALQYGKTYKVEEINQRFNFYVNDEFYKSSQTVNYKDVIFISTSETFEDLGHSVFYNRKDIGLVGGEQILLKSDRKILDGKYLFYYSKVFGRELKKFATGVKVFRFDVDDLKTIYLPLPKIPEQTAIANYLDEKTSKLDLLISNKKAQINQLKEIRQIEINTAVTKGLDPNVKLKPSGVEWLGDIPQHWEVTRLKNVSKIINGSTPKSNIEKYWDGDITWVTPSDISKLNGFIFESRKTITKDGYDSCGTEMVSLNSTILTCRAPIGNVVIAAKELCTNQGCKSLFSNEIEYRYLYYFILSANEEISSLGQGTTFLELSRTSLGDTKLSYPKSKDEQISIANYLDERTSMIDQLVSNLENQINQLQEIRKIEIYNAVTGKIKVG